MRLFEEVTVLKSYLELAARCENIFFFFYIRLTDALRYTESAFNLYDEMLTDFCLRQPSVLLKGAGIWNKLEDLATLVSLGLLNQAQMQNALG